MTAGLWCPGPREPCTPSLPGGPPAEAVRRRPGSGARGDVLVYAKHVLGVIDLLQLDEAVVRLRGVGGLDAVGALAAEVVDVDPG